MTTPTIELTGTAHVPTVRNAGLQDMMELLSRQQAHKIDLVIPAGQVKFVDGMLIIEGQELIMDEDGFDDPNGAYWPTQIFDDQMAERLGIGTTYVRRLRHGRFAKGKKVSEARLDLWDANANGLLRGRKPKQRANADGTVEILREGVEPDKRSFFMRLLQTDEGYGVARAMLSDRFARLDNIDGLMSMLTGIQEAGVDPATLRIYGDISETKMYVHVAAPQILAQAETLLEGYRSPFDNHTENGKRLGGYTMEERIEAGQRWLANGGQGDGHHGFYEAGTEPLVHAGFLLTNSEVGNGRWVITPEITILACTNGLTINKDKFARTHVGSVMDDGHVDWSIDTQSKELAYVSAQTRDVVKAVLSREYLEATVADLTEKSGKEITKPEKVIEVVGKKLAFSKDEQDGILRHFLMGNQHTSGGVMNAITSYSQTVASADAAHDLNAVAVDAMNLAYAAA